jgi:hypothetical protein
MDYPQGERVITHSATYLEIFELPIFDLVNNNNYIYFSVYLFF